MRRKVIAHILFDVTTLKSWESGPGDDASTKYPRGCLVFALAASNSVRWAREVK